MSKSENTARSKIASAVLHEKVTADEVEGALFRYSSLSASDLLDGINSLRAHDPVDGAREIRERRIALAIKRAEEPPVHGPTVAEMRAAKRAKR